MHPDARTMETRHLSGPLVEQPTADSKTSALNLILQVTLVGTGYYQGLLLYFNRLRYPNIRTHNN